MKLRSLSIRRDKDSVQRTKDWIETSSGPLASLVLHSKVIPQTHLRFNSLSYKSPLIGPSIAFV